MPRVVPSPPPRAVVEEEETGQTRTERTKLGYKFASAVAEGRVVVHFIVIAIAPGSITVQSHGYETESGQREVDP